MHIFYQAVHLFAQWHQIVALQWKWSNLIFFCLYVQSIFLHEKPFKSLRAFIGCHDEKALIAHRASLCHYWGCAGVNTSGEQHIFAEEIPPWGN